MGRLVMYGLLWHMQQKTHRLLSISMSVGLKLGQDAWIVCTLSVNINTNGLLDMCRLFEQIWVAL